MRLRLGRPDLSRYAASSDLPRSAGGPSVTFLGVSTLLLDDGTSRLLTDGFFSRPGLLTVGLGMIAPDEKRIRWALERVGVGRVEAVLPVHSHYDHALDSPAVAAATGARLAGGESTLNIGRGQRFPEKRMVLLTSGEPIRFGAYRVLPTESHHCPPDRYPGVITEPVVPPTKAAHYRCGEAWSFHVTHDSGATLLIQGSAGFVPGALDGQSADVVYLGVGQLGLQPEQYIRDFWRHTVEAVGARTVVLIHWDDFFRPLDQPLRALPHAGDDLDVTMRVLGQLASQQGVGLRFPAVFARENPWGADD
jgi:L-ascorbate metabolism protein UlaG (beta-lactamase superfamily)